MPLHPDDLDTVVQPVVRPQASERILRGVLLFDVTGNGKPLLRETRLNAPADAASWPTCIGVHLRIATPDGDVGDCKVNRVPDLQLGVISYGIDPPHRRQGLGTAAVGELLVVARRMGLVRLKAHVLPSNDISMRVLRGHGFDRWSRATAEAGDTPLVFARWTA